MAGGRMIADCDSVDMKDVLDEEGGSLPTSLPRGEQPCSGFRSVGLLALTQNSPQTRRFSRVGIYSYFGRRIANSVELRGFDADMSIAKA